MNPMRSDFCPAWSVPALPKAPEDEAKEAVPEAAGSSATKKAKKVVPKKEPLARAAATHEVKYEALEVNIFGRTFKYQRPVLIDIPCAKDEIVYGKKCYRKRFDWDEEELSKRSRDPKCIKSFINT